MSLTHDVEIVEPGKCVRCGRDAPPPLVVCPQCADQSTRGVDLGGRFDATTARLIGLQGDQGESAEELARREFARRTLARRRLIPFIQRLMPSFVPGWFHFDLAARLERFLRRVEEGKSPRMILNVPPRHGKSLMVQYFSGWALGHNPAFEIISTSHTLSLSLSFSRKVRELLKEEMYRTVFPETRLQKGAKAAEAWQTDADGGYRAAGVGGSITGHGAHILLIDDPVKNADQARSAQVREQTWEWYTSTAYTRLAPGGGVLLIMTRWHLDDLTGRILAKAEEEGKLDQWELVVYSAIAEQDEYRMPDGRLVYTPEDGAELLRREGEALHPERWPLERLTEIRTSISAYDWAALYQQRPQAADDAMFLDEMFRYYDRSELPTQLQYYVTFDLAVGQSQRNDRSVAVVAGVDAEENIWIVDVVRGKWDSLELVDLIIDLWFQYRPYVIALEHGQISMTLEPLLQKRMEERKAHGLYYEKMKTGNRDKVSRARAIQGRMQQGRVFFPNEAPWLNAVRDELRAFPVGAHDDVVDALAWVGLLLADMARPDTRREPDKTPEWQRKLRARRLRGKSWLTT